MKAPPHDGLTLRATGVIDAKGSFFGDPGEGQITGERSEAVFTGAAGKSLAVSKAERCPISRQNRAPGLSSGKTEVVRNRELSTKVWLGYTRSNRKAVGLHQVF